MKTYEVFKEIRKRHGFWLALIGLYLVKQIVEILEASRYLTKTKETKKTHE